MIGTNTVRSPGSTVADAVGTPRAPIETATAAPMAAQRDRWMGRSVCLGMSPPAGGRAHAIQFPGPALEKHLQAAQVGEGVDP